MKPNRKTWLYFILNSSNQSITWDSLAQSPIVNGVPSPRFIPDNPSGWYDIEISAATNMKYFSLNRQFATNLKFVKDAANVLRWYSYNGRGYDNDLYILIQQWNRNTGTYDTAYKAKLDFTTFVDFVESGVTIDTKEGGILEFLNSNDGIEYEIPCDETNDAIVKVRFDGINLSEKLNYQFIDLEVSLTPAIVPVVFINNEGDHADVLFGSPTYQLMSDLGSFLTSSNYLLKNIGINAISFHFSGTLKLSSISFDGGGTHAFIINTQISSDTSFDSPVQQIFVEVDSSAEGLEIAFSFDITLQPTEKIFIWHMTSAAPPVAANSTVHYDISDFSISFISKKAESTAYALTWYDWFKQMVLKISDGKCTGDSVFLASRKDLVVTCGDAIRNTDKSVVPIYYIASTFADGFKSMSSKFDFALDIIDGILYIEPKTSIYNHVTPKIFELGEISNVSIEAAVDLLINDILCGFTDQTYDQNNGKYEFNSEQEWKAPVTLTAQKQFDIRSVWRGDCFGIEFLRSKFTHLDTTDNAGDKTPFMVQVRYVITPDIVQLTASKGSEDDLISGDLKFDSTTDFGGSEVYISANSDKNEFTYINTATHTAQINSNIYGNISGSGIATFELRLNGTAVASATVDASEHFFVIHFSVSQALNQNDILTINIQNGGTNIDIQSAGLDIQIIGAHSIPTFDLLRDTYTALSGVIDDTIFNVNFSPHRDILAHAAYLSGLLNQMQMDSLTLTSSAKNVELSTTLDGVTILEKAPIVISTLLPALFLPYYAKFKCRPQYSFLKTITSISGGYIHATYNGNDIYMLPIGEMQSKPASNETQEWRLLLAPNNVLSNLLKLSQAGLFLDYMGNLLFISDLNPVHFVKYDYTPDSKYHFLDLYDEWVRKRNDRFSTQPNYIQPWKVGDEIKLQFITANLGQLQLDVKDCDGNTVLTALTDVVVDSAVQSPYMLQQATLSGISAGGYYIVLSYLGTIIAISEMQKFSEEEKAYLFEYSSTYNVLYGYFSNWKPYLRCDCMLMQWQPESDFENYEDDPGDAELVNARSKKLRNLILGTNDGIDGSGLPDFMMNKMNMITLLNNWNCEGKHYVRTADSKMEPTQRQGNPFDFYTMQVQEAFNEKGLSFTGISGETQNGIISYTLDATGFGMDEGILTIEIEDE